MSKNACADGWMMWIVCRLCDKTEAEGNVEHLHPSARTQSEREKESVYNVFHSDDVNGSKQKHSGCRAYYIKIQEYTLTGHLFTQPLKRTLCFSGRNLCIYAYKIHTLTHNERQSVGDIVSVALLSIP